MRHLGGLVLGVLLGLVSLLVLAYASYQLQRGLTFALSRGHTAPYLVVAVVAGLLFGLVLWSRRLSPAGPLVAGVLLLVLAVAEQSSRTIDRHLFDLHPIAVGQGLVLLLASGIPAFLGAALVVSGLLPAGRTRSRTVALQDNQRPPGI